MWKNCSEELPELVKPDRPGCPMSRKVILLFANNQASIGHFYAIPSDLNNCLINNDSVLLITDDWNSKKSRLATRDDLELNEDGYTIQLGCTHGYIPDKTRWTEIPE